MSAEAEVIIERLRQQTRTLVETAYRTGFIEGHKAAAAHLSQVYAENRLEANWQFSQIREELDKL